MTSKYFVLLPDGIGLRNFAYTSFSGSAKPSDAQLTFWNSTPFDLESMGYDSVQAPQPKLHKLTDIYKDVRKHVELDIFRQRENDPIYESYKFPRKNKGIKAFVKNSMFRLLVSRNRSEKGLERIRQKIKHLERSTPYFSACKDALEQERPDVLFCTNQRPSTAIAPIEAAKSLGIPTVTFIFSWDNLPKATMVIETDYYFVWSEFMKQELLKYYPYINEDQVRVTGTPQFEGHFDESYLKSRSEYFATYGLDVNKDYICFSGDDVTTSPNDAYYLEDVAQAVQDLNNEGHDIGIVFRRCPVDFSGRYDQVIKRHDSIIVPISPKWEQAGSMWNAIMPTKADTELLVNTAEHTQLVINVGSSMVFDYVAHDKPCAYLNYDTEKQVDATWSIDAIYKFVHFRSMPDNKAVLWLDNKRMIRKIVKDAVDGDNSSTLELAKEWFRIIAGNANGASSQIWQELENLAATKK